MSAYLVLARKYRPKHFGEVIGQEVVTEVLRGALTGGHLGHAYLFAGPRGTGKTTLARILAKCLNCERGPTPDPCGTCERCRAADSGSEVDIIELDAASHTGVDHIRELRDEVAYAPMRARYKVYIVDEVHMLSKAAFNALLKTLEEPPAHVVFLFATTDPHKVLDTVLSRCQVLRLVPLPEERIVARLEQVFAAEGVRAEAGVTAELARRAHGGMRDALSLADKLLAFAGDEPRLADLERLGGEAGSQELDELLTLVESGDRAGLLARIAGLEGDEEEVLEGLLAQVRSAALLAFCGESTPLVTLSGRERSRLAERGGRLGPERLELWLQQLLRARERARLLPGQERLVLELCLLDLARSEATLPLGELVRRLEALEQRLGGAPAAPRPASAPSAAPAARVAPPATPPPAREAAPGAPAPTWDAFLAELRRGRASLAELLARLGPGVLRPGVDGRAHLVLSGLTPDEQRLMADKRNQRACEQAHQGVFGLPLAIDLAQAAAPRAVPGRTAPVRDPLTERMIQDFEGTMEELT
ncbi:MAG TPA: DNA polymerase III subunit gamma/tau [Planctomycetota bacterium]